MRINTLLLLAFLFLYACTTQTPPMPVETGVALEMAEARAQNIRNLKYDLFFDIPENQEEQIPASITISFELEKVTDALQIDFKEATDHLISVTVNEAALAPSIESEHIVISAEKLAPGQNNISIEFIAGELSLNRSEEYLYTLLVPDRARTVFPCFDQPNLKARFKLSLEIPKNWEASANGSLEKEETNQDRKRLYYKETAPISTYLFAFAAGAFQKMEAERNGRPMAMLYRESDTAKVKKNANEIFDLHAHSLNWLEEYTGIPYPFEKFDFVLIPTFQYGGMEHVGNIFYREGSLMLDEGATINRKLGRASLIAHETAHMWFGDLVTMDWFNDVWLKEVFANFMAAKIVNPNFPEVNHDLRFMLAHQPSAYGEDRTEGSHPIQQPLDNLKDAGTLYGRIIYQKAPVVMLQLEKIMGEENLKAGLRQYLKDFSFNNATWDDLIAILDERTDLDLNQWSRVWVKEPNMPVFKTDWTVENGKIASFEVTQEQKSISGKIWQEASTVALFYEDTIMQIPVTFNEEKTIVSEAIGQKAPLAVLSGAAPISYGYFLLDEQSKSYLLSNYSKITDPIIRGAVSLSLYETYLNKGFSSTQEYFDGLLAAIAQEEEILNRQRLLGQISTVYWRFFSEQERNNNTTRLEGMLWDKIQVASDAGTKRAYFNTYQSIALSSDAISKLKAIHQKEIAIEGLRLSENDFIGLASALALRLPEEADQILANQLANIQNPDRKKRFEFIMPSLSPDPAVRDSLFESLKKAENRAVEPWAGSALSNLNHPLRAKEAVKYILPSLELLEEIQVTGDIFFPRRWIGAAFSGHNSKEAAQIIRQFLADHPDYPSKLKNKILMGGDMVFRASGVEE